MTPQIIKTGVLIAITAAAIAGCGGEAPKQEAARPVLTERVGETNSGSGYVYAGEVRSRIEQPLAFRIGGKVIERYVDAGAVVKPGQILAKLDPVDAALSASAAEAQRQLADAEAKRYRELKGRNFVSQAALDSRETSLKAAAAQADLARNQSAYTVLKADQPGVVGQVLAEVGQVVTAGQAVFRVARPDTLEIAIGIPENRLAEMRTMPEAEITLWADESRRYKGKVREIAAMADPATRTYAARVAISDIDDKVIFGMSANVRIMAKGAERLSIPQTALFQQNDKPAVWVVADDGTIALRPVDVARYADNAVELSAGLARGERIVIAGVHKLSPGERIRIAEREGAPKVATK